MTSPYPDHQALIAELDRYQTKQELLASAEYKKHQPYLEALLHTPKVFAAKCQPPILRDFLRVAHWNIEKGKHLDAVIDVILNHPALGYADLISINEADAGMNRSGQRFVAKELGEALGLHVAFAPSYLEFSKGYGDDLEMPGENTMALQGNAILSRYEIKNARVLSLPLCYDHFEHAEKRIGNRNALAVDVQIEGRDFCFVTTHLEVRNAPTCRAKQIATIVKELEKPGTPRAAVIAGDFNTNTFARGGTLPTLQGLARMMLAKPEKLRDQLAHPQELEPLFTELHRHGFTERGFNTDDVTCYVPLKILEDSGKLPGFLTNVIQRQMARYDGQLDFRLDWIIGRNVKPLSEGEQVDFISQVVSQNPQTITGLANSGGGRITDHDPIVTDLRIF